MTGSILENQALRWLQERACNAIDEETTSQAREEQKAHRGGALQVERESDREKAGSLFGLPWESLTRSCQRRSLSS